MNWTSLLLMIQIRHDLIYKHPENLGSIVYTGCCRIYINNHIGGSLMNVGGLSNRCLPRSCDGPSPCPGRHSKRHDMVQGR